MFTKMQQFCILAFVIAPVLVFADANEFAQLQLQHAAKTTAATPAIVGAPVTVAERAKEGVMKQNLASKVEQQQQVMVALASAATKTLSATTTATPGAATTPTDAATVTLASSNAPATLTTTNDADERVLSTTATPAVATATDDQANQEQLQQQQRLAQAKKNVATAGKKQMVAFNTNIAREESTTAMPTKINAAALGQNVAIQAKPATSTTTTTTARGAATKVTEVPTVNFESKSCADALPSGESAMSSSEGSGDASKDNGNDAKTQIIKNAQELGAKTLNERADAHGERAESGGEKAKTVTNSAHEASHAADEQNGAGRRGADIGGGNSDEVSKSRLDEKQKSETVKKPQPEQKRSWPKRAVAIGKQEANIDNTESLILKHSVTAATNAKSQTTEGTTVITTSERTQQHQDDMNTERKLKNGLYRIKLAEIVTDEYNGSGSGAEEQSAQQKVLIETGATTTAASTPIPPIVVSEQVHTVEAQHAAVSNEDGTTTLSTLQQQQATEQLGQLAQQTSPAKPQKQQQARLFKIDGQPEGREQVFEQQQQPLQLRREQQANKDMETLQVQLRNEYIAGGLAGESDNKSQNINYEHTDNNKQQRGSDQAAEYSTPQATPPALNIVDLYPMKMEDFNPIIRDSNARLLKERTIYQPADSAEQRSAEVLYEPNAKQIAQVGHSPRLDGENVERQQQNILPNEVNAADNIIQRYDNINNLAAHQSVNHRANTTVKTPRTSVGVAPTRHSSQQTEKEQPDDISDFTGKVLAEQDGVITEIEQKFRLNEFAATATATATALVDAATTVVAATVATTHTSLGDKVQQPTNGKSSYSVNHKIQLPKSIKHKYASNSNNNGKKASATQRSPQPQHDFIERRVKKSFDFPMHRAAAASASDVLAIPHVDFANTKFNTGNGATQTLSDSSVSGTEGGGSVGAMRSALGTHPEFSTTKFYNSKELYNEMMQHNRKRLKAKAKQEQAVAATVAATTATQSGGASKETAASRFALRESAKVEVAKYVPVAEPSKPIMGDMGEVHMNSQRAHANGERVGMNADDMRLSKVKAAAATPGKEAQSEEKAKSSVKQAEAPRPQKRQDVMHQQQQQQSVEIDLQLQKESPGHNTTYAPQPDANDKPTKKYQKELQRAKLLLKSMLLQTKGRTSKSSPTAATITKTSTTTTTASTNNQHGSQSNLHAPPTARDASAEKLGTLDEIAGDKVDLIATAKTFGIMSLRRKGTVATPTTTPSAAAVGNIDSTDESAAMPEEDVFATQAKRGDFDGIVYVKRAKPTPYTTTISSKSAVVAGIAKHTSPLTLPDELTTPSPPLIYPYPQLHTQQATPLGQPHDTIAAISSTSSTMFLSSRATTTTNLSKSPSKPIVRPRILSPLQEKINSLECELQNLPSDSHLWRGNETHELLLPIMTSENCPYGGTDCSPLLVSWEGEAEIQSGDILIVEINDTLLNLNEHNNTHTSLAHNTQVYQVTRSGHEHCDVTEGILLDITPLFVDGRKLVTLYDKDLTEGVNLLIVVSELWGSQCVRLKVTAKTDNCGESAECSGKGICYSNSAMEEYECQCCSGFAGPHCEEIDACTPSPCTNNGICVDLSQGHEGNSYQCLCPYGYTGKNCQYESDPCNSAECKNGGSCVGNSTHFRCDCTPGYTGPLCQHSLNECESSPCVHGICVDQEDGFRCFCQPGFAGELCNFEYNECESNPCQNDGECIDHIGNFECRCTKGYTGARCQIKVEFCANKPCPDGHRCIDHGNDFSCECPGGRNGLDCNQMPRKQCNENLCKYGGTCWTSGASFYCACRPGYTGNMCEDEFVVETVVSSSEFMVDDTSARNFNDKTFGSSVVLKSPIELHNAYFGAGVLAAAVFIVAVVVAICHCKVNQTYRKFSTRSSTFFPILGFGRRSKSQNKLNKHWLSGKGLGTGAANGGGSLRSSGSTTSLTRGHLPSAHNGGHQSHQRQQQLQQQQLGGQMHERPFQRHLAMNLENDMYYTVDFSENSQHSPLIQ